jgi:hypothetical protein
MDMRDFRKSWGAKMKTKSLIITVSAILFCIACGINTTYAGPTASITLSVSRISIPADEVSSVAITATLRDSSGLPVDNGTTATFKTTLGKFLNGTQTIGGITSGTGIIVVSLMSEATPGIAEIECTSNNVKQYTTVSFDATGSITLTASPEWIPADGHSSSTLTAVVLNTGGLPVEIGTEVAFTTTRGLFSNGTAKIAVRVSNAIGSVSVSLISSSSPGVAEVTCTSNLMTQTVTVAMGVGSITLTATPTSLPADGHSSSEIKAVVKNSAGVPVSKGTSVTFSTTLSEVHFSNGTQTITMGTIDASGIVTVALIAGTTSGRADVLCSSGGVTQSVSVSIGTLPIAAITLTANPTILPADGTSSSTITATVLDASGKPLNEEGVSVTFTTNLGQFSNGRQSITVYTTWLDWTDPDVSSSDFGKVLVSLMAGTTPGVALIKCESGNVTQSINMTIGSPADVASIILSASPTSLPADGGSSSAITATILDVSGNPLNKDGVQIKFTTTLGNFAAADGTKPKTITVSTTWVDPLNLDGREPGKVVVSLIAGTESGIALITCQELGGGVTQTTNVTIGTSAQVATITLSASPTSLPADGISSSAITALLKDITGNPITQSNIPVTFTTTQGHFSNGLKTITVITANSGGSSGAVVVSLIAGTTSETAVIICASGGVTQATTINIGSATSQAASIVLSADPTSIPADSTSFSTITATLYNGNGLPVGGGVTVTFTTSVGYFANLQKAITANTNAEGVASVNVYSGSTVGTANIMATSNGILSYVLVNFIGSGSTADISLSYQCDGSCDSATSFTITAALYDKNMQPVTSGVPVNFTTTSGYYSNNLQTITAYTNSVGIASVAFYSGGTPGTAHISASSNGITRFIDVVCAGGVGPLADIVLSFDCVYPCDSSSSFSITAALYDTNMQPVSSGVLVTFTTTLGYFSNKLDKITAYTDSGGVATVVFYTGGVLGTAQITASSNGITRYMDVICSGGGLLADIVLSFDCVFPCDSSSSYTISAALYDTNMQPVSSGVLVTFTTTLGYFSNKLDRITAYTGSGGVATVVFYTGGVLGTAQLSASSNGITRYIDVICSGGQPPADIFLSLNCNGSCDTSSYFTITATVYDKYMNTVSSGVAVDFTTTLGYFSNKLDKITAYTDSDIDPGGVATAVFYSGGAFGTAQISASSYGITRYMDVICTGAGTPALISLSSARNWMPADGNSYTAVTAVILDGGARPVAAGTLVTFTTAAGVFENGSNTYMVATPDAMGTITVHLKSTSTPGFAYVTCTWDSGSGKVEQSITLQIVTLEYETEPNNDMVQSDQICFDNVYLSQLFSPYEEDWYTFTIKESSRIGINFITTAAPADAGCEGGTTTVGTWKVDIRDKDNNMLMSFHNIDCIFDNGIWETGVVPPGTYYVVVYCPRLGSGDIYLSDPYYMRVFNNFYFPCTENDRLVNSASLTQKDSAYHLHVPLINAAPYLWADLQYDPISAAGLMFRLTNYAEITDIDKYSSCNMSILSLLDGNYVLHIPVLMLDGISYRVDLTYVPSTDGLIWFMLSGYWLN